MSDPRIVTVTRAEVLAARALVERGLASRAVEQIANAWHRWATATERCEPVARAASVRTSDSSGFTGTDEMREDDG